MEDSIEEVIRQVGDLLLGYWPSVNSAQPKRLEISEKPDGTKVTSADLAANELLVAGIKELFPGQVIISEELPLPDNLDELFESTEPYWIMDPLDGTHAFMEGREDFSVLVAQAVAGEVEFGYLFFPAMGILAKGARGDGAVILDTHDHTSIISKASTNSRIRKEGVFLRKCFLDGEDSRVFPTPLDSGIALLKVASGELDGVIIRMLTHREWDLAAPAVVIEESGGKISDEKGQPVVYRPGELDYRYFVASNGNEECHQELLSLIPHLSE